MRLTGIFLVVLLLGSLAFSQSTATVISGYAGNWGPQAVYAVPYVPLVTTPSVQLGAPPMAVGASSATAGLATGASTSTLSIETPVVSTIFPRPVWYGAMPAMPSAEEQAGEAAPAGKRLDFGVASFEPGRTLAQRAADARAHAPAKRTYTNDDIARVNQSTGMIKRGKQ